MEGPLYASTTEWSPPDLFEMKWNEMKQTKGHTRRVWLCHTCESNHLASLMQM